MKILFLSWNYPPAVGGIEYVIENLFRGLSGRGHDVTLLTSFSGVAAARKNVIRASRRGLFAYVSFALVKGFAVCRSERPEVILCGSVVSAPSGLLLSRLFRVPTIMIAYGAELARGGWFRAVVKRLFSRASGIVAISEETRSMLVEAGVPADRLSVVHPGVRTEDFETPPVEGAEGLLKEAEGRKVLLTVGRLVRRKGVLEFVERVMPELVRKRPDVMYLVVGDDATASLAHKERMREKIQQRIVDLGLERNVRLSGSLPQRDLIRLFFRADLFVLPCIHVPGDFEGFGIVFLEAALARTPAVATRVGGIPEAVEDGTTGFLVDAGDWKGMLNAIERILENDGLRAKMADAACRRAGQLFNWERIVGEYERSLGESIAGYRLGQR